MLFLGYKEWRYFDNVIEKSELSCFNSNIEVTDHFVVVDKMVLNSLQMQCNYAIIHIVEKCPRSSVG